MDGPPWENHRQEDIPQQGLIYRRGLERLSAPLIGTRFLKKQKQKQQQTTKQEMWLEQWRRGTHFKMSAVEVRRPTG